MLLAIDVGNTHTVIGIFDGEEKKCGWRISTVKSWTADELRIHAVMLLESGCVNPADIDAAIMCSVVPRLTANWQQALHDMRDIELLLCTAEARGDAFPCTYPYPNEIGMDYIADAVGAVALYGAPVVVFDFGTATNISIIDRDGNFKGGIIAPGVETGAAALFSKATQLTSIALRAPEHVVGQSTDECIRAGVVLGEAARVDGLSQLIFEELGYETPVIATGGLATSISAYSKKITATDPELTLSGLRVAFEALTQ